MKTGEAAAILGVDRVTLYNWMEHPLLRKFFSPGALLEDGGQQRILNENDVLVLNTIRAKRAENIRKWEHLADILERGTLEREFPQNAISADRRTIPMQQAEQSARALATLTERDQALMRIEELSGQVDELTQKLDAEREQVRALLREMADLRQQLGDRERLEKDLQSNTDYNRELLQEMRDLQRQIGKLEGQLEFYREQKFHRDA